MKHKGGIIVLIAAILIAVVGYGAYRKIKPQPAPTNSPFPSSSPTMVNPGSFGMKHGAGSGSTGCGCSAKRGAVTPSI